MNLESRVERLESLLLPQKDYRPEIYDALIQMDMVTAGRSRDEAEAWLGDKENFINDYRRD